MADASNRPRPKAWLNGILFALTVVSTFIVGLFLSQPYVHPDSPASPVGLGPFLEPRVLLLGGLYAVVLMVILTAHELGHYLTCRRYGVAATLPYFLPAPNLFGTFGAFIKIKSPIHRKQELFDIGAAGPLAGFVLALPALAVGLAFSKVGPVAAGEGMFSLGEPLLLKLASAIFFKHIPAGADIVLHPVAFAGWVGLLVTSLNLFPIGQLDGGHVAYAMFGRRKRYVSSAAPAAFLILGVFFFSGWLVWAFFALLFAIITRVKKPRGLYLMALRLRHPQVLDEDIPLDRKRMIVGLVIVLIFILSFIPDPVKGYGLLGLLKQGGMGVK